MKREIIQVEIENTYLNSMYTRAIKSLIGEKSEFILHALEWTKSVADQLSKKTRSNIAKEIDAAIENNSAGDPCDVKVWTMIKDYLVNI